MKILKVLVAMLVFLALCHVPETSHAVIVKLDGANGACNVTLGLPPPVLTEVDLTNYACGPFTFTAINPSYKAKVYVPSIPADANGADVLRLWNTRVTTSTAGATLNMTFRHTHSPGPYEGSSLYYKRSAEGNFSPTAGSNITAHYYVGYPVATPQTFTEIGSGPLQYTVSCDQSGCATIFTLTPLGTQWTQSPYNQDRVLKVELAITLAAVGSYVDFSPGVKLASSSQPDLPPGMCPACPVCRKCPFIKIPPFQRPAPVPPTPPGPPAQK